MARHFQKAVVIKISVSAAARQALARRVRGLVAGAGAGGHAKAQTTAATSTPATSSSAPSTDGDGSVLVDGNGEGSTSAASDSPQLQRWPECTAHASMCNSKTSCVEARLGTLLLRARKLGPGFAPVVGIPNLTGNLAAGGQLKGDRCLWNRAADAVTPMANLVVLLRANLVAQFGD